MKKFLSPLALSLLLVSAAATQDVVFRGEVASVGGTFVVAATDTVLRSSTVDLTGYVGQQTLIEGLWDGSTRNPMVFVKAITKVHPSLELGGDAFPGGTIEFVAFGDLGESAFLVTALGPGFLPLGNAGVAFFDLQGMILLGSGAITPAGAFRVALPIPRDPSMIGLEVFGQAAILGRSDFYLTNPAGMTIL